MPLAFGSGVFAFQWTKTYNRCMTTPLATEIATAKRGGTYSLRYEDVDVAASFTFDRTNFETGLPVGVSWEETMTPDGDTGTWTGSYPLDTMVATSRGVHIAWEGDDITVSYSTDNTTWTTLTNYRTILEDVATAGLFLFIRVQFLTLDSWLKSIRLDLLGERIMTPLAGTRNLSFKSTHMDYESEHQLSFNDDSGATLTDGYIQIEADAEATPVRTVELWVRFEDTAGFLMRYDSTHSVRIDAPGNAVINNVTVYRNGAPLANGSAIFLNTWVHYIIVFPADVTTEIKFGNNAAGDNPMNMNIGHLAYYDYAMTATDALKMYNFNVTGAKVPITEVTKIRLTEATVPVDVYAYDWSITSA